MRAKPFIAFPAIALLLAACTQEPASRSNATSPNARNGALLAGDVLLLGTERGPVTVDPATGSQLVDVPDAVAGPDGSRLYLATNEGGSTSLETLDARTGSVLSTTRIRGDLDIRFVSVSGRAAALMEPLPEGVDAWTPIARSRTAIVVADPTGRTEPRRYELAGNFEPEAFSTDDSRLFMIQYLPAEAPTVYRVTVLELAAGEVHQVAGRFKSAPERMPGIRLEQVLDPLKAQLYTLYTNEPGAYAEDYGTWEGDEPVTFVHVLNLKDGWAYCAGIPREFWGQPASAQAMAASPDGGLLYIIDSMRGAIAVMDALTLEILRTEKVDLSSLGDVRTSAQMSTDGDRMFVGSAGEESAVDVVDTATLDVLDRWPVRGVLSSLGLSPDGLRLYVALDDRVATLDAATGDELAAVPLSGVDSILHVSTLGA